MKELFITLAVLILFSSVSQADIQKCRDSEGGYHYYTENEKLPEKCVKVSIIETPTETERQEMLKKREELAEQEYRERVKATAKFLDDVDAVRKKR